MGEQRLGYDIIHQVDVGSGNYSVTFTPPTDDGGRCYGALVVVTISGPEVEGCALGFMFYTNDYGKNIVKIAETYYVSDHQTVNMSGNPAGTPGIVISGTVVTRSKLSVRIVRIGANPRYV